MPDIHSLCAESRPGDGIPPHLLKKQEFRDERNSGGRHHAVQARQRQYCKAAQRSIEAALSSVCGDERLKDLQIESVQPASRGSNLLVVVTAPDNTTPAGMLTLEQTLQNAAGLLRSVVATEIQRKRTPRLTFRVVPAT